MDVQERNRRIAYLRSYIGKCVILRSPESWREHSDVDIVIGKGDFRRVHNVLSKFPPGFDLDVFTSEYSCKGFELFRLENIEGINELDQGLEKIIFIIKDLSHFGAFRHDKYLFYKNRVCDYSLITDRFVRASVKYVNESNYYFIKTIFKIYAEIHLLIWARWKRKDSCGTRNKKIISKYHYRAI